ncbi:hypothetical protein I317_02129 [Kwoniella heveanensis CBS 569]|uniref:DNA replication complex GINS protein SLD5 n=1 Tax=Kwoniella heveanensis BCC8398 TaxID=1296120 RepID=A0A1B9GNT1_9TREE|nr:hypothetical protein I316_05686 [Kwoniella heveanensis BCC8398]OCF44022.1 hypothetical protein I317_02129 [Kwoniella heveanensis CBS 569]
MSFFDDDPLSPEQGPSSRARASASLSREPSVGGSSSFLDRLRSTVSPPAGQVGGQDQQGYVQRQGSRASNSIYDDTSVSGYAGGEGSIFGRGGALDLDDEYGTGNGVRDDAGTDLGLDDLDEELDDVRKLGMIWVKERGTPELMPWEGDLMDSVFDKLEQQAKMVNTLRSDPQTSEEEHFKLMLVQTEVERVKYLVRSYVRTRLHKIEKHSHFITLTPSVRSLLSGAELSHAQRYTELLHTHFQHSVLDSLPEWLRGMDDTYGDGLSMISKPNRNTPVLIYCRKDCGEITLEGGERAALARGTTHLVKYRLVARWIQLGWAEVL